MGPLVTLLHHSSVTVVDLVLSELYNLAADTDKHSDETIAAGLIAPDWAAGRFAASAQLDLFGS